MASVLRLLAFVLLFSVLQCIAFAQVESPPQTRLSSKGLAFVNLSTSPAVPVSGQPTVILLQFLDPQTKAPRADLYYKVIIRNETGPIFVLPGGSTIAGKVGIPYQFDKPGNYQVEVALNDTDISQSTTGSLDTVSFPLYVSQSAPKAPSKAPNATAPDSPSVNIEAPRPGSPHLLTDAILAAAAVGLGALVLGRRIVSKRKNRAA